MLKMPEAKMDASYPVERPIGEVVRQLIDEGKDFARAEVGLVKANAAATAARFKVPAILFAAAFLLSQAAVVIFCLGMFLALLPLMGPIFAAVATILITFALAGIAASIAVKKIKGSK